MQLCILIQLLRPLTQPTSLLGIAAERSGAVAQPTLIQQLLFIMIQLQLHDFTLIHLQLLTLIPELLLILIMLVRPIRCSCLLG